MAEQRRIDYRRRSPGDQDDSGAHVRKVAGQSSDEISAPAVPPTCPKQRSATVAGGQQRSVAGVTELRQRPLASSPTVLPKLAVLHRGLMTTSGVRQ
jgi:hypothetical protein